MTSGQPTNLHSEILRGGSFAPLFSFLCRSHSFFLFFLLFLSSFACFFLLFDVPPSHLFPPFLSFFFPLLSLFLSLFLSFPFPLFLLLFSFCFLLGVGFGAAWQRRFLCFLLLSVSCFCFLCFQLSLSLWPLFSASASGSSISSPLFILSSISSVHGSVLTLAAMAFSCRHWVRVMVRLSMW